MLKRLIILSTILLVAAFLPPIDSSYDVVPGLMPKPVHVEKALAEGIVTWPDTDGDGCLDMEEAGPDARYGGSRSPTNPWDFYDVSSDGVVDFWDVLLVAFRLGSKSGEPVYDSRPSVDRANAGDDPKDFANLGPPDGVVDWADLKGVYAQSGHTCLIPTTYDLTNLEADCDGNIREITDLGGGVIEVPEEGKIVKECFLIRDPAGKIVDVIFSETYAEKAGGAGGAPDDSGVWRQTGELVEREFLWPPDWLRCTPGFGFLPRVCAPQSVFAGLYMSCEWRYFDGPPGHVYDGVVELIDCDKWHRTRYPMSVAESYPWEWHWVVQGFQGEAEADSLIQYAPFGDLGIFQQLTYRVGLIFGPWDQSEAWTN